MRRKVVGIALAAIMLALVMVAMVPVGSARTGNEGLKGLFMMLGYITLGLSLLIFVFAFVYLLKRRKAGVVMRRMAKEEEIIETIRMIKELKKKIEERGENLTSLLFVIISMV